jgi:hypothetical protein
VQHLEVMADCGLGQVEGVREVTHARLATRVGRDQGDQPESDRVGHRLQDRGDSFGLLDREGLALQR